MSKLPRLLPLVAVAIGGVIAVRAIGVAPGLFQGSLAWAREGEAVAEGAATPAPGSPVCSLTEEQLAEAAGLSPAELRVLQSLSARRGELDARDTDFATLLPLLAAAEQKLDERVAELESVKTQVEGLLGQLDEKEQAEIDRLVSVYSAMRPRDAAAVFTTLDDSVRLPVAAAMRPRALAAILAQMPPAAARDLTEKLARRYDDAQQGARAAVAAADSARAPQPTPAAQPAPAAADAQNAAQNAPQRNTRPTRNNRPQQTQPRPTPAAQPSAPPPGSAAAANAPAQRQPRQSVN